MSFVRESASGDRSPYKWQQPRIAAACAVGVGLVATLLPWMSFPPHGTKLGIDLPDTLFILPMLAIVFVVTWRRRFVPLTSIKERALLTIPSLIAAMVWMADILYVKGFFEPAASDEDKIMDAIIDSTIGRIHIESGMYLYLIACLVAASATAFPSWFRR